MNLLDAYGHVALPRFMSAEEFLRVMDENRVEKAHVCTAETCPDLEELSRAAVAHPDRLLVSGLPLGENPAQILDSVRAQLDSGFIGLRISERSIAAQPELLDALGEARAIPFLVGGGGFPAAAGHLLGFLEYYPECLVCAPHFAGVGDPALFERDTAVAALFAHPRFAVIFSRHGAFDRRSLIPWAGEVVARVGWSRIMFGSEYPVALFRDETYESTTRWMEDSGIPWTGADREAFLRGNAERLLFSRKRPKPKPLDRKWFRMDLKSPAPVWLFPNGTLDLPEDVHRRLLEAYLKRGGERSGSFRGFVADVLARGTTSLPE